MSDSRKLVSGQPERATAVKPNGKTSIKRGLTSSQGDCFNVSHKLLYAASTIIMSSTRQQVLTKTL